MTEETRRSGRATKGQHTGNREITETPTTKKKGTAKKVAKAKPVEVEEEEPEEKIRCICGEYEEETDIPRAMVCCDKCDAWQHNDCMGLPEDYEADSYFCEECKPENHKALLAAMKKGQKPWEEAAKKRAALIEAERASKKKGKKGGRKSAAAEEVERVASPAAGQKRKAEESPAPSETKGKKAKGTPQATPSAEPAAKGRKAAAVAPAVEPTPAPALPSPTVPKDAKELAANRRAPGQSLVKLFIEQTTNAVKDGFALPDKQTAAAFGTHLGLLVEDALHQYSATTQNEQDSYKTKLQAIVLNLKRNHALSVRIVKGEVTPEQLASMSPAEMVSEEQKAKDAEMQAQLDKQATLVNAEETAPTAKRTKGDEDADGSNKGEQESKPAAPIRSSSEVKSPTAGRRPPSVTIPNRRPSGDPRRQSSASNFDISNVYNNVQGSPVGDQRFGELPSQPSREAPGPGARPDADIDNLLKDEDGSVRTSPPYSPKAAEDDGAVWRGLINGGNVGRFHGAFKFAAGSQIDCPTLQLTWDQLLPGEIGISGRIDPVKADDYLCGLEYSNTSDLIVVWMGPPGIPTESEQFETFFNYFRAKDRFGVGKQNHNPALKDIYFIPLEKGQQMPTFFTNLESSFPQQAPERLILVPLVIKNSELPRVTESPAVGGAVMQTPITPREPWQPDGINGGGPAQNNQSYASGPPPMNNGNGPPTQQAGFTPLPANFPIPPPANQASWPAPAPPQSNIAPSPTPPNHQQPKPTPTPPQHLPGPPPTAPKAAHAAFNILGPQLWLAPAVQQLISTAPTAGEEEMSVIKECIADNPAAAEQLGLLTDLLQRKWADQQAQAQGGSGGAVEA